MVLHHGGLSEEQLERLSLSLSSSEKLVLEHMTDGEWVYPMANIASESGIPLRITRKILRKFRDKGIAGFGPLTCEDDNTVRGSGYFRSSLGEQLIGYIRGHNLW